LLNYISYWLQANIVDGGVSNGVSGTKDGVGVSSGTKDGVEVSDGVAGTKGGVGVSSGTKDDDFFVCENC